jgi:hypothetical protein
MSTLSFAGDEENKILYKVDGDLDDDIRIRKTTKTAAATIKTTTICMRQQSTTTG